MPLTQLSNMALDRIRAQRTLMIDAVLEYAETDLLRPPGPKRRSTSQSGRARPGSRFSTGPRSGHRRGPRNHRRTGRRAPACAEPRRLAPAVEGMDDWRLTALQAGDRAGRFGESSASRWSTGESMRSQPMRRPISTRTSRPNAGGEDRRGPRPPQLPARGTGGGGGGSCGWWRREDAGESGRISGRLDRWECRRSTLTPVAADGTGRRAPAILLSL